MIDIILATHNKDKQKELERIKKIDDPHTGKFNTAIHELDIDDYKIYEAMRNINEIIILFVKTLYDKVDEGKKVYIEFFKDFIRNIDDSILQRDDLKSINVTWKGVDKFKRDKESLETEKVTLQENQEEKESSITELGETQKRALYEKTFSTSKNHKDTLILYLKG